MAGTTTATVLYPTPPPTVNRLDAHQRHRLMRSTDKLARVLGTTPYLLESSDLPITLLPVGNTKQNKRSLNREHSVVSHTASSSRSSFGMDSSSTHSPTSSMASLPPSNNSNESLAMPRRGFSDSRPSRDAPRNLFIRLNTIPISPSDDRFAGSLPPTPTTATPLGVSTNYTFPPTPCTPTFDQAELRRKRMAKLSRHLGEPIPPQLVFPQPRTKTKTFSIIGAPFSRNRRSMSVGGGQAMASELGLSQHKPTASMPNPLKEKKSKGERQVSWIGEWNKSDKDVQKKLRALKGR